MSDSDEATMINAFPRLSAAQQSLDSGKYAQAAHIALQHVRANPNEPRGLGLLGTIAMRMGALDQAEKFLRQALMRAPNSSVALRELASCLHQQERPEDALQVLDQLEAGSAGDAQIGGMIAQIQEKLGRTDLSKCRYENLTSRYPDDVNLWLAYAHHLRSAGLTDDAVAAYRRATELDFERGDAWWGIASIRKPILTDDNIATMQKAVSIAIDVANLAPLHLALARAWHERQDYEKAFHHYSEGNRVRAEALNYNSSELTSEINETERLFGPSIVEDDGDGGDPSSCPIFIVSLPRSGSTLLEQMLGSHPSIEPLGELPYIPALLRSVMERATRRGIMTVPEAVKAISPADRLALGQEYSRRALLHRKTGASRYVDKLPHNWSNALFIRCILPHAKFLDIRRNAMDCCFSNFTQSFSRAHASSFRLEDIGQCYVDYVRLMAHLDTIAPGLVHHIAYDDLVADPEPQLRAALGYLELEWDPAVLEFHKLDRVVRTPSSEQVRRPLNRDGMDIWRPYERHLDPLRKALGPLA